MEMLVRESISFQRYKDPKKALFPASDEEIKEIKNLVINLRENSGIDWARFINKDTTFTLQVTYKNAYVKEDHLKIDIRVILSYVIGITKLFDKKPNSNTKRVVYNVQLSPEVKKCMNFKMLVRESISFRRYKDPKSALFGKVYKENDPFLDELNNAIEERFSNGSAQNYDLQIDFNGDEEEIIDTLTVKEEYNVDFTDSEERHPWVEIETIVDFNSQTITTTGNLSSKNGDIDEDATRKNTFDRNTSAKDFAEMIWVNHDEVADHIESAGEQQANREYDKDDYDDEDNDDEDDDYDEGPEELKVFAKKIEQLTGLKTSVEKDNYWFIEIDLPKEISINGDLLVNKEKGTYILDYNRTDYPEIYKGDLNDVMMQKILDTLKNWQGPK